MTLCKTTAFVIVLLTALTSIAFAEAPLHHPVHGYKASPSFEHLYSFGPNHGMPEKWSRNDLVFTKNKPRPETLTEDEKYIVAGAIASDLDPKAGLSPWNMVIFSMVDKYYATYGKVPDVLNPEAIRSLPGLAQMDENSLREYLNPLTDKWPRLTQSAPSPGDLYMRPLTRQEMSFYAWLRPEWKKHWFDNTFFNPRTGNMDESHLTSKVWYMRVYGFKGVIYDGFMYCND